MQNIQPKRSKYKKSTKRYVKDSILDIIDIEETLLKNRFISKVQPQDFLYSKFLPKHDSLKPIIKPLQLFNKERISPVIESNKIFPKLKPPKLILNPEKINYENLNKNKFEINFKELTLEYKNGYKVLFIKEYYPVEIIGAGTFGLVVNVIQIKTGQKMAVKIIDKKNSNLNSDYLNKEVYILSILDDPRIMKVYDILDNIDYYFIFMELIEGGNLKDLIIKRYLDKNIYLFRDSECAQIMKGLLEALNYLHKKNIIHRDIKPENILFKNKDDLSSVILCDFGLAYQMKGRENSTTGVYGTTIYMAPEIILKKNYDFLVDSFSAGIVLYILCSGGQHPFYTRGLQQKEYIDKLINNKCICKFSAEMPLLARNLFLKLCKFEPRFRYPINKALNHPWITRSSQNPIPLTIFEEYNKSEKIKNFKNLLSSIVCLVMLKKTFMIKNIKKRKKKEMSKNNSYYENFDNNRKNNNNKYSINSLLYSIKKSSKNLLPDNSDEKIKSPKKNNNLINSNLFSTKTTKNIYKYKSPVIYQRPNFSINNGINEENNNNNDTNMILKTQSFKENENKKNIKKRNKSKTMVKHVKMKSSTGQIFSGNNKLIKDIDRKHKYSMDFKNNNQTIKSDILNRKNSNNIIYLYNTSKSSKNNNHKFFLRNHIIIESKNNNKASDSRKNNNSSFNLSVNKNNNDESRNTNMNAQMRNKLKELKKYNQMYSFQKVYNKSKNQNNFFVLRNVFNNSDF